MYEYERAAYSHGYSAVCGVDEAGRGPLAGDVFAAAVILAPDAEIDGVNDSKKLSEKKRDALYDIIMECAVSCCVARASVEEIESINILQASMLAMRRAVSGMLVRADLALVDGNSDPGLDGILTQTIIKGDEKSASIAAASILAKVSRDRYMLEMDALYPEYQFAKHKGYGTKLHYEMIRKYGASPIHRACFLKKFYKKNPDLQALCYSGSGA